MSETRQTIDRANTWTPPGLSGQEVFADYMRTISGSDRRWLMPDDAHALPFWEINGRKIIGGKTYVFTADLESVARGSASVVPWEQILRSDASIDGSYVAPQCTSPEYAHVTDVYLLDLQKSLDELRAGLEKKWRNQLKKAEREQTEFRACTQSDFDAWYDLYAKRMVEHGNQPRPAEQIRRFIAAMGERVLWNGLWQQGRLVAGGLGYRDASYATVWWQASDALAWSWCANNLFYWRLIENLRNAGVCWLDLGPTSVRDAAGAHFKRGMGAAAVPVWNRRQYSLQTWKERLTRKARGILHRLWKSTPR